MFFACFVYFVVKDFLLSLPAVDEVEIEMRAVAELAEITVFAAGKNCPANFKSPAVGKSNAIYRLQKEVSVEQS